MTNYLLSHAGSLRLSSIPHLARSFVNRATQKPVPPPGCEHPKLFCSIYVLIKCHALRKSPDRASSTEEFLTTIGRGAQEKLKVESWEKLWTMDGHAMKAMGISIRDRRCGDV